MAIGANRLEVTAGDVVRMKSGGAVMTAERVFDGVKHPFARCIWFGARKTFHRAFIDLSALDLVNPEDLVLSAP
jgi:uncharacterized protein YodC (DUF2158 family)